MIYNNQTTYLEWLKKLLNEYNIDTKDLSSISLVGFNTLVLSDLHEVVNFNVKNAIKESHVITADKLDSLYKHAREVGIHPTLSIPAKADFLFIIDANEFDTYAVSSGNRKSYTISKENYVTVGDHIYSLDRDITIITNNNIDDEDSYVTAMYVDDVTLSVPSVLDDIKNPTIKCTKRKTSRGWEYHLYLTLKQYAREVMEREFQDRDYSAFNYTASGQLVTLQAYRERIKPQDGELRITPLDIKMYFENSRTSEDSIYIQYESTYSFNLIHKSQEHGFRPIPGDKLITYIYTTNGEAANFTLLDTDSDVIQFQRTDDTLLEVQVVMLDGKSKGGKSYIKDTELLRQDIINRKATRDSILTENDVLMHIRHAARHNEHHVIKNRNDILTLMYVYTTLKTKLKGREVYIPSNTLNVDWYIPSMKTYENTWDSPEYKPENVELQSKIAATKDILDGGQSFYNSTSFIAKCTEPGRATLINATEEDLLVPLMEEFRLGLAKPNIDKETNTLHINDEIHIPVLTKEIEKVVAGQDYFYNNRIYRCKKTLSDLDTGAAVTRLEEDIDGSSKEATFDTSTSLYYYLPYYITYVYSKNRNFIKMYEQTVDKKYDTDYKLNNVIHPYSFICNWVRFSKPSLLSDYNIHLHMRNNITNFTLIENKLFYEMHNGRILDTNRLQTYIVLYDKTNGTEVYADKLEMVEYNSNPDEDDDYINYTTTILPAGYIPRIIGDKIAIWSNLHNKWIRVPITNIKAEIRVYNIDNEKSTDLVEAESIEVPNPDVENTGVDVIEVNTYKNVDYTSTDHLVNTFSFECDILTDITNVYKIQHSVINENHLRLWNIPLVQYTFYKYYSNLYHKALEDEYAILEHVHKFHGQLSLALKYTNTYGFSSYYTIGKSKKPLNNLQLDMTILVKQKSPDVELDINAMNASIAEYISQIDFVRYDKFHISRLYDYLFDLYRNQIDFLEFKSMNGKLEDNQLIEMSVDNLHNNTVVEKINIPYTFDGDFNYIINWQIIKPEVKR